jgi:hypothetical protein
MKKIIGVFAIFAGLVLLAAPAFAQTPDCSDEGKAALYTEFTANRTTDSAKAYDAGKKYLGCSQTEDQYTAYLKKWVTAYEKESRKIKMPVFIYTDKKFPEGLSIGKEILADEPENVRVIIDLGYGSYLAAANLKNESFNTDALNYSRRAIQMIEGGKVPASWAPFKGKEDTLAYLYDVVGRLTMKDNPAAALTAFLKKAQFETDLKKDPWTYFFIAAAYESGPYAKLSADYKACCEGKDETPQSKLLLENINQVIDRMIDAYARAVAVAGTDAKYAAPKKDWMEGLSTWYKYRNGGQDTGLNELIASVLSKPLPPEPTPLTTLPAAATTSAPAAGGAPATTSGTTTTMAPTTTPATAAANSAKPAATTNGSTAPAKPKPRNNHATRSNN